MTVTIAMEPSEAGSRSCNATSSRSDSDWRSTLDNNDNQSRSDISSVTESVWTVGCYKINPTTTSGQRQIDVWSMGSFKIIAENHEHFHKILPRT